MLSPELSRWKGFSHTSCINGWQKFMYPVLFVMWPQPESIPFVVPWPFWFGLICFDMPSTVYTKAPIDLLLAFKSAFHWPHFTLHLNIYLHPMSHLIQYFIGMYQLWLCQLHTFYFITPVFTNICRYHSYNYMIYKYQYHIFMFV